MTHKDKYCNFEELSRYEKEDINGKGDFRIVVLDNEREKDIVIMAPHGGGIEPHTSKIAKNLAGEKYCLYLFEGTKKNCNFDTLHITSTRFNEPRCLKIVANSTIAIAIHGKRGNGEEVEVGGRNIDLVKSIVDSLSKNGFKAKHIKSGNLSGTSINNICNKTSTGEGVQIEIMMGLRKKLNEDHSLLNKFSDSITQNL